MSLLSSLNKFKGNNILSTSTVEEWRNKMAIKYAVNFERGHVRWQSNHSAAKHLEKNPSPVVTVMWSWASSLPPQASVASLLLNGRTIMRVNIKISIVVITETLHWSNWTYFHDNTKMSFALVSHSLWRSHGGFQRLYPVKYHSQLNAEQGENPSVLKRFTKMWKCLSFHEIVFENKVCYCS